ncbi:XK-related protein 4-like protein, partial [Leptotrombidium deliense]
MLNSDSEKASAENKSGEMSPHGESLVTEEVDMELSSSPNSSRIRRGSRKCQYRHHHSGSSLHRKSSEKRKYATHPPRPSIVSINRSHSYDDEPFDNIDALPTEMAFTWLDAIAIFFSIGTFLFDIGTDVVVAVIHYQSHNYVYFALTACFIIIPTLVTTGISLRWYVLDAQEESSPPVSALQWTLRIIFLLLQLGPILRYFDSLVYGFKFRQQKDKTTQKKYFQYMVYEDTDAAMLRLFECFMEAAPQLILQLYILAKTQFNDTDYLIIMAQVVAVLTSLVSLSWSLVSYQRSLRMSLPDKANMSWQATAVQFLWRFFVLAARVLALALFATSFKYWISVVCGVHWALMFSWIISMKTTFCENRVEEVGYNAVLAVMFIFCYFNPVDNPTRYRYTLFYTFMLLENTLLMCLWYINSVSLWYRLPAMIGHYLSFMTGIMFMIAYYLLLHPSGEIRIFRNSEDYKGEEARQEYARRGGYKREIHNGLWTTHGRMLHPRPTVPEALPSSFSDMKHSNTTQNSDA